MDNEKNENDPFIPMYDEGSVKSSDTRLTSFEGVKVKKADLDVDGQFYFKPDRIDESEAREEGYWGSLCLCLCPTISWRQFIVWISIVEIIFFIISCCIYGVRNESFLAPDPHALEILGWQDAKKIKNDWQIHRWFMPIFLHGHFEHLMGNLSGQLFIGAGIEYGITFWPFVFLYMLTGIGGNLLSCCIHPESYGVGASTSVFGLVGYQVAYIFTNWQAMGQRDYCQRLFLIVFTSSLILMNLNIGPGSDPKVDNWGHLGGGITGFFASIAITEHFDYVARRNKRTPDRFSEDEYERRWGICKLFCCERAGAALLISWVLGLCIWFYAFVDVDSIVQESLEDNP